MLQVAATNSQYLRDNLELPEQLRQCAVLLKFREPILRGMAGNFLRIQLTPVMLAGGEDEFFLATVSQPHLATPGACRLCRQRMVQITATGWRCINPQCRLPDGRPTRLVTQLVGPKRGVVKLLITDDCIDHVDTKPVIDRFLPNGTPIYRQHRTEWLKAVVLMLDRRYDEGVLAAVKRTAGVICDEQGWTLRG